MLFRSVPLGYLYIDEKNEIIFQKTLQKRLAKLAYFLEIFYNTENKSYIVNTFQDEGQVKRDNDTYKLVTDGLDILTKDGNMDTQKVKQMVLKLPDFCEENNKILKAFMIVSKKYKDEKKYFNIDMLEKLLVTYRESLSINLKKIRLVYSVKECYENIKLASEKKMKPIFIRINFKLTKPLIKTSYMMDFFIKVVNSCEIISEMTDLQYFKYLGTIEEANVNNRVKLIRSKKN